MTLEENTHYILTDGGTSVSEYIQIKWINNASRITKYPATTQSPSGLKVSETILQHVIYYITQM